MKNFNRGGGFNDRKSSGGFGRRDSGGHSGGRGFSRGGNDSRPEMHQAVCSDCGQSCEVPFKPTGDRPVLCSNCFKGKDNAGGNRSGGRDFSRPSFGDKKLFKATCAECGQSCEVPFQPSSGKPVYCSQCFGKGDKTRNSDHHGSRDNNSSKEQFEILNSKLDKILRALNPSVATEEKNVLKKPVKKIIAKVAEATKVTKVTKKVATVKKNKKK